jgi:SP family facilitated glucose transporter-like MFS transporter 1
MLATAVPSLLQIFGMLFCVESPRHLVSRGDYPLARRALQKLRGRMDVENEVDYLISVHERDSEQMASAISIAQLVTQRQLRKPLIIAIVAMLSQQLSGINGVMQFSTDIFNKVMDSSQRCVAFGASFL